MSKLIGREALGKLVFKKKKKQKKEKKERRKKKKTELQNAGKEFKKGKEIK